MNSLVNQNKIIAKFLFFLGGGAAVFSVSITIKNNYINYIIHTLYHW